jgi:hypothetical protein
MSSANDSVSVLESPASDPGSPGAEVAPSFPDLGANNTASFPIENDTKPERSLRRRWRKSTKQEWTQPIARAPYHQYVHQLVDAGWENLRDLDNYMIAGQPNGPTRPLVISVLDI